MIAPTKQDALATPRHDDFLTDARNRMVDSQIRPNKVSDPRILDAMRHLPREMFLPEGLRALAYSDQNVPLGNGRVLLQPMVLARLVQAAEALPNETALVIAAGTGYSAALLAAIGCKVTALESGGASLPAKSALAAAAPLVTSETGSLREGWPAGGPYDIILIDGAVSEVPSALASQLRHGSGRLLTIIRNSEHTGYAVQAEPTQAGISVRQLFDCVCPLLPEFVPAPTFKF